MAEWISGSIISSLSLALASWVEGSTIMMRFLEIH
ncbi:hypothetical protein SAMN06265784_1146 [Paraburkholderia susongensis]|uniref:Uncharacterized protein n=1 Tax=Paraburkholderia susongensis TaxID=1515439 RepID=A0A1X7M0Q5_9BURK|nr:hypothetical protein SAMN06265784_1146 [Paraburkholderia susongensis]